MAMVEEDLSAIETTQAGSSDHDGWQHRRVGLVVLCC